MDKIPLTTLDISGYIRLYISFSKSAMLDHESRGTMLVVFPVIPFSCVNFENHINISTFKFNFTITISVSILFVELYISTLVPQNISARGMRFSCRF